MDTMPAIPTIEGLQIHQAQGWLFVSFAYHPKNVERIKSVPGRRWHPAEKCWSIPHTGKAIAQLRHLFSDKPPTSFPRATPKRSADRVKENETPRVNFY